MVAKNKSMKSLVLGSIGKKMPRNPFRGKKGHWGDEPPPALRDADGKLITKKQMFDTSDWFW